MCVCLCLFLFDCLLDLTQFETSCWSTENHNLKMNICCSTCCCLSYSSTHALMRVSIWRIRGRSLAVRRPRPNSLDDKRKIVSSTCCHGVSSVVCVASLFQLQKRDTKVSATIKKKTNQVPSSSTIVSVAVAVSASVSIAADSDSDLSQRHTQNFGHTDSQSVRPPAWQVLHKC